MASLPNSIILLCVFLLIKFESSSSSFVSNLLLTGQSLGPSDKLSYGEIGVSLVMQFDCTLALRDGSGISIWESNSTCIGCNNCFLSFTDNGRLVIANRDGHQRWITPNEHSPIGNYVAVLRPEGEVAIYGPAIWSVGPEIERTSINSNEMKSSMNWLKNKLTVYNVLFSSQVLYQNGKLSDNGHTLIMTDRCELILENKNGSIPWRSKTDGEGKNCFARLNHKGELSIRKDNYRKVWSNEVNSNAPSGEYVLVMQENGDAVIYGPKVWSTADPESGLIKMVFVEK